MIIPELDTLLNCYRAVSLGLPLIERQSVLKSIEFNIAASWEFPVYLWNLATNGYSQIKWHETQQRFNFCSLVKFKNRDPFQQATDALAFCHDYSREGIFVLENVQSLISQGLNRFCEQEVIYSWLVNTVYQLGVSENKYLILLDTNEVELPRVLSGIIPSVYQPLPGLSEVIELLKEILPATGVSVEEIEQELSGAVSGLTVEEIKMGVRLAVRRGQGDNLVDALLDYKIGRLQGLGLDFIPKPNVTDFGGLDRLKQGLVGVQADFSPLARTHNIPLPKGWLLVGPPGTGKTFAATVCARYLGFPLISVGVDAVMAGGAAYLKRLLRRIEATSPAVCYFDEFDKFFMANKVTGEDSKSKQVLGVLLTWLQEKRTPTFVIATLNRLDALPPELTRAGRFDKIYYVGFPQANERKEIFQLHASRFDPRYLSGDGPLTESEWKILLGKTQNCTGAEIRSMVESAARKLFHEGLPLAIGLPELLQQREVIVPLYVRDTERVLAMENRAKYVSEPASSPDLSVYAPPLTSYWGD
ncbi:MAG: AAA family ATPase [Symploca sp. SIO1A3]|nr:AAA family ATPase [Symploca sp. SIO1A3]